MTPAVTRLVASAENFAPAETGAAAASDWPLLADVLERELAVIRRLSLEPAAANHEAARALAERTRERLAALSLRVARERELAQAELAEINAQSRRLRALRSSYARPDRSEPGAYLAHAGPA